VVFFFGDDGGYMDPRRGDNPKHGGRRVRTRPCLVGPSELFPFFDLVGFAELGPRSSPPVFTVHPLALLAPAFFPRRFLIFPPPLAAEPCSGTQTSPVAKVLTGCALVHSAGDLTPVTFFLFAPLFLL